MPYVRRGSTDIHYEATHAPHPGAPWLLLIPGLSANTRAFPRLVDALSAHHHVVLFDPRGAGLTVPRAARFDLADVALDAVAVLDALAIASCDVLGISMGGMIAQELALRAPERVGRLVLTCTTCGRRPGVRPSPATIARLIHGIGAATNARSVQSIADRFGAVLFAADTPAATRASFFSPRFGAGQGVHYQGRPTFPGVVSQLLAVRRFAAHRRLPELTHRTLVIHGAEDVLVPTTNAGILARAIPNAELEILPGAHVFFFEHHERYVQRVRDFLGATA